MNAPTPDEFVALLVRKGFKPDTTAAELIRRLRVPNALRTRLLREDLFRPAREAVLDLEGRGGARRRDAELLRALLHGQRDAVPPGTLPVGPPTQSTLMAWAKEHELSAFLQAPASALRHVLHPRDAASNAITPYSRVHDLAVRDSRTGAAIRAGLVRIAELRRAALDAPPPLTAPSPDLPGVAPVWAALQALRARVQQGTWSPPADQRASWAVTYDPVHDRAEMTIAPSPGCHATHELSVALHVAPATLDRLVRIDCDCPGRGPTCPTRLGAVERMMEVLADPTHDAGRLWRATLATPAWSRALARVRSAAPRPEEHPLGWRLTFHGPSPTIEPVRIKTLKNGGVSLSRATGHVDTSDPIDRELLRRVAEQNAQPWTRGRSASPDRLLLGLVDHPRVFHEKRPVRVVAAPWQLVIGSSQKGGARPWIRHLGALCDLPTFLARFEDDREAGVSLDPTADVASVTELSRADRRTLVALQEVHDVPAEGIHELLDVLSVLRLPAEVDAALRGEPVPPADAVEARLTLVGTTTLRVALRARPLPGGESYPPGRGLVTPIALQGDRRVTTTRDLDAERARLAEAWGDLPGEPAADVELTEPEVALGWLERAATLPWLTLTWEGRRWRADRTLSSAHVRLAARDARSWFAVDGVAEIDADAVPLSALLDAVQNRKRFVPVGPDRWVRLTDTLRAGVQALAHGQTRADGLQLSPVHAPLLEALVQDGATLDGDVAVLDLMTRCRAADDAEITPPAALRATLRPYQRDGHRFLARLARWAPGAILADDMGLGKTVQTLALLLDRAPLGAALVVAPTSVGFNWLREAERHAPGLRFRPWRGSDRAAMLSDLRPGDVLVTSYELAQRDAALLAGVHFATLVLDEAQAAKNPATQRHRALRGLDRDFTVALTGTPMENRLEELWALIALTVPGLLSDLKDFRATWANPIAHDDDAVRVALARRIRPFLLRRTKAAVAPELPERTVIDVVVPLAPDEQRVYDAVRRGALAELSQHRQDTEAQARIRVLAALTALRRVACHPALHDPTWRGTTSKLDRVRELVSELRHEGHRALLFSQFVGHLQLVRAALEADGHTVRYLDGSTPEATRRAEVDRFQAGDGDVFLISLKAGGTGLNLTAATYVLHLDPWWNPAVEDQATDRAHRIGQTRAVTVYRVVAAGTVEQQILGLHEAKRRLVAGVLEGTDAAAALSAADLVLLLRGEEPVPASIEPAQAPRAGKASAVTPPAVPAPPLPGPPSSSVEEVERAVRAALQGQVEAGAIAASSAQTYSVALSRLLRDPAIVAGLHAGPVAYAAALDAAHVRGPLRTVSRMVQRHAFGAAP